MFIQCIAPDCYYIPVADLKRHSDSGIERSFASSEQAIAWIKNHPGLVVKAVPRGGRGEKLAPQKPDPNFTGVNCYSLENGDILCGDLLVYDQLGLRIAGLGTGSG